MYANTVFFVGLGFLLVTAQGYDFHFSNDPAFRGDEENDDYLVPETRYNQREEGEFLHFNDPYSAGGEDSQGVVQYRSDLETAQELEGQRPALRAASDLGAISARELIRGDYIGSGLPNEGVAAAAFLEPRQSVNRNSEGSARSEGSRSFGRWIRLDENPDYLYKESDMRDSSDEISNRAGFISSGSSAMTDGETPEAIQRAYVEVHEPIARRLYPHSRNYLRLSPQRDTDSPRGSQRLMLPTMGSESENSDNLKFALRA